MTSSKNIKKANNIIRNSEMRVIQTNDPTRLRTRVVLAKKGKGSKTRPRNSNRTNKEFGE